MAERNKIADVEVESNKEQYEEEFLLTVQKILTMLGMECSTAAQDLAPVDTGLLQNSITYALAGETAAQSTYKADHGDGSGRYSGNSPRDTGNGVHSVHIGTNVEYAMAQEVGNFRDGSHAYLRPAVNNNIPHFKRIVEDELKKAMANDK